MHYMVSYEISPETRNKAQERFKAGGGLPPDGVAMVARWHYSSGRGALPSQRRYILLHLGNGYRSGAIY